MTFLAGMYLVPSLILLAGVVNDLKSRKVKNWLSLSCAALAISFSFFTGGMSAVNAGLLAFVTAFVICLPLVLMKLFGAGDMKLLLAFALSVKMEVVIYVIIYSLFWGAVLGLVQIIYQGRIKQLFKNTLSLIRVTAPKKIQLHTIPYTVPLFLGWLSYLSLKQVGGV